MASVELESALRERMRQEIDALGRRGFDGLNLLPVPFEREDEVLGKRVVITVWREKVYDWQIRIVVRIAQKRWFGMRGLRVVEGFRFSDENEMSDVTTDELAQYA